MKYDELAPKEIVERTAQEIRKRGIDVEIVNTKGEALEKIKSLIPTGSEVMTGSSTTLEEIGLVDFLKNGNHKWNNLKEEIVSEKDEIRQAELRKKSITSDYFLGSVHAVAETGELLIASASGSQIPSYAFSSDHVIWVVGTQKIVPTLEDAFKRLKEYVFLLEDKRMKSVGYPGSTIARMLIFEREIMPNRKINLIFVNEKLGF